MGDCKCFSQIVQCDVDHYLACADVIVSKLYPNGPCGNKGSYNLLSTVTHLKGVSLTVLTALILSIIVDAISDVSL